MRMTCQGALRSLKLEVNVLLSFLLKNEGPLLVIILLLYFYFLLFMSGLCIFN